MKRKRKKHDHKKDYVKRKNKKKDYPQTLHMST